MDVEGISWQNVAQRFQKQRLASIPVKWLIPPLRLDELQRSTTRVTELLPRLLSHNELQITSLGVTALAEGIQKGLFSCIQVAEAFCHQAAVAQQLTNCLTEILFTEALDHARRLDDILRSTGKPIGPLHGVPVSVKDHFNIKGQYTTAGYIAYGNMPVKDEDSAIVQILRKAGAVIYTKTTNPQTMMVLETTSNIYGRTVNPYNTHLSPGGSSGGESALLAMNGSPLGVGSDIGGSIRVPAAYTGLYGLKPSAHRVPSAGLVCTGLGAESISGVAGPLAHNVEDLDIFMRIIGDSQPWLKEPVIALPWISQVELMKDRKLTFGIMLWDEVVRPHPYITKALNEVSEKLKNAGHEVIEFKAYDHLRAWEEILLPLYFTDGGSEIKQTLRAGNEPMLPSAKRLLTSPQVKERTMHELWKLNLARDQYRCEYLKKWADTASKSSSNRPMDILICPAATTSGTPHDYKPWWGYSAIWNLLDYCGGIIPVGSVLEADAYPHDYKPVNDLDRENVLLYKGNNYLGMPIGIQLIAKPYEDEKLVGAMDIVDKVVNGSS
ncbi:hypothetical protein CDD81_7911 [Ophiocordyceps australis]|uniref:amidase n=1 Tax=Ophiocordyceps australis TaxID=1399860 RepID=A0A2C5XLC6_9HYPO|nr:hypothetical protein CDD81_7911 [Ophiocordyceps australis]